MKKITFFLICLASGLSLGDSNCLNAPAIVCSSGWIRRGGKCYKLFSKELKTYDDAEAICKQQNGHLVSIGTKEEHFFLVDYILREVKESELKSVWIGGKRKKSRYIWMSLEPFNYSEWHSKYSELQKSPVNNCIELATAGAYYENDQPGFGKFLLQPCTGKENFICQVTADF